MASADLSGGGADFLLLRWFSDSDAISWSFIKVPAGAAAPGRGSEQDTHCDNVPWKPDVKRNHLKMADIRGHVGHEERKLLGDR